MNHKILFAEDEHTLAKIVSEELVKSGYHVTVESDGKNAFEAFKKDQPDVCILDIMMPVMDGYTLAEHIRDLNTGVPILFLSAKALPEDVIRGFKSGGHDYLRKPFNMGELLVRTESLLMRSGVITRASKSDQPGVIHFAGCTLDTMTQQLTTSVETYTLSFKETALLDLLLNHRNELIAKQVPLLKIWGDDSHYNARSMDVFMSHLRKMLKDEPGVQFMSIRGAGYRLIVND
jgi:DNA-binding response OmpR family regulator